MRSKFLPVLMGGVILLVFSCATVPTGPLAPGELRLLRMEAPREGEIRLGIAFTVKIQFEADGRPEVRRACFFWSGDGPYCTKAIKTSYGSPKTIYVDLVPGSSGQYFLEGYVQYVQDGKSKMTNVVGTHIFIIQ